MGFFFIWYQNKKKPLKTKHSLILHPKKNYLVSILILEIFYCKRWVIISFHRSCGLKCVFFHGRPISFEWWVLSKVLYCFPLCAIQAIYFLKRQKIEQWTHITHFMWKNLIHVSAHQFKTDSTERKKTSVWNFCSWEWWFKRDSNKRRRKMIDFLRTLHSFMSYRSFSILARILK